MSQQIIFFILAAIILTSAIVVVTMRNLFHAALALMVTFLGVAGIYVLLEAGFDGTITGAGARVELDGEVLKDTRFQQDLAARIVDTLDAHDAAYILEAPESLHGRKGVDQRLRDVLGPIFAGRPQQVAAHAARCSAGTSNVSPTGPVHSFRISRWPKPP